MIDLHDIQTSSGRTLDDLSNEQPVLLVFLRQLGCMFCREAMATLGGLRQTIEANGTKIVLVHIADTDKQARTILKKYDLDTCDLITDPACHYYARFGLLKSSFSQLFGFTSWVKTIDYGINKKHGFHLPIGDGFQLPGMFMLQNCEIIEDYRSEEVYEQPPFDRFIACCSPKKIK
jgi:peroxiredoxin